MMWIGSKKTTLPSSVTRRSLQIPVLLIMLRTRKMFEGRAQIICSKLLMRDHKYLEDEIRLSIPRATKFLYQTSLQKVEAHLRRPGKVRKEAATVVTPRTPERVLQAVSRKAMLA